MGLRSLMGESWGELKEYTHGIYHLVNYKIDVEHPPEGVAFSKRPLIGGHV